MNLANNNYDLALVINQNDYPAKEIQKVRKEFKKYEIKLLSSEYASLDFPENLNLIILLKFAAISLAVGFFTELGKNIIQILQSWITHLIKHKKSKDPYISGFRIQIGNLTIFFNVSCPSVDPKEFLKLSPEILIEVLNTLESEIDEKILYAFVKTNPHLTKNVVVLYTLELGPKYIYDLSTKKLHTIENPDQIGDMIKTMLSINDPN